MEAVLLADRASNAFAGYEMWSSLDPEGAEGQLRDELGALVQECDRLAGVTQSSAARRQLAATGALCATRSEEPPRVLARVERFFEFQARARRESGDEASLDELVSVAAAGVAAHGATANAAGMQELMRRMRVLAEPAGGSLPGELLEVWSRGIRDLDPSFAQMLASQMLHDEWVEGTPPSDTAFRAAYAVFDATAVLGEGEHLDALVRQWLPLALASPPCAGAQAWLALIDEVGT